MSDTASTANWDDDRHDWEGEGGDWDGNHDHWDDDDDHEDDRDDDDCEDDDDDGVSRTGDDRPNTLEGTGRNDRLDGRGGDDKLYGRGGHDKLIGGPANDQLYGGDGDDWLLGGNGTDQLFGGDGRDALFGGNGDDTLRGGAGSDLLVGGAGNDRLFGGSGADFVYFSVSNDGADRTDLGSGSDVVFVDSDDCNQVRLTFTSSEVGNGDPRDSTSTAPQDGGLAVRLQAEDDAGNLTGPVSRFDDEGITFVAAPGTTFDVRDLVSGAQRGDRFQVVTLGTQGNDDLDAILSNRSYYINGGMGDDDITGGNRDDFLVGGAGNDVLRGGDGNDSFIGGGGDDRIFGGAGSDRAIFNVTTDGSDRVNLGTGSDLVDVSAATPGQVRLTFTSSEVGNGAARDSNTMANQDGGLAVRLQAEDGSDGLTGPVSRFDDEGITFVAGSGVTFDVRDLVAGTQRGDQFKVVSLGTQGNDALNAVIPGAAYYFNAGMGNDTVTGGSANDFLVGGAGDDVLRARGGDDTFIGGGGNDRLVGGAGMDAFIFNTPLDGSANVDEVAFFSRADDIIRLDDAVFTGLMAGPLDPEAFARSGDTAESDDRIIYNQDTGELFFDANGGDRGDAVLFARLGNMPANLDASDFVVF